MKKGIRLLAFLLLLGVMVILLYRIFSWKDTSGDYLSSTQQLYHTPENTIDVVFVGSSHCYCTIYPALLWESRGMAAFDMAVSGQDKDSSYHMLKELCKTQNPKVVGVDVYGLLLDRQGIEGNVYRNMLAMRTSANSIELIKEYVEPDRQMDFFLKWPIIHTRFWELGKYDYVQYEPSIYGRGAVYQWGAREVVRGAWQTEKVAPLEPKNEQWLKKMMELSRKEGFELFFFAAPFLILEEEQEQINAVKEYVQGNGLTFFDFNKMHDDLGIDVKTDYRENFHLNAYGAGKITEFVGNYLSEKFEIADRRGAEGYEFWDQDLKWYRHLMLADQLQREEDPQSLMSRLAGAQDVFLVVSIEDVPQENLKKDAEILKALGFSDDEVKAGGKWILTNGTKQKVLEGENPEPCIMDLNQWDSLRIKGRRENEPPSVMINYTEYLDQERPVNVIVYDLFLKEAITTLGF